MDLLMTLYQEHLVKLVILKNRYLSLIFCMLHFNFVDRPGHHLSSKLWNLFPAFNSAVRCPKQVKSEDVFYVMVTCIYERDVPKASFKVLWYCSQIILNDSWVGFCHEIKQSFLFTLQPVLSTSPVKCCSLSVCIAHSDASSLVTYDQRG